MRVLIEQPLFHRQPGFDVNDVSFRDGFVRVTCHWLDMGVDGLRLRGVANALEGDRGHNVEKVHGLLRHIRQTVAQRYPGRALLADVPSHGEDGAGYFGAGDECHLAFNTALTPRLFMALKQENRRAVVDILRQMPEIPATCQWAIFLRNADELSLRTCNDREREYLYQAYAPDRQARLNSGIRRRLAPLLDNDRRRIELAYALLLSLPGTPILYYGNEIRMGDNVFLPNCNSVRTPMQWSGMPNGGFSRADPGRLYAPLNADPVFGYQAVNVEAQERQPFSLLNWMRRLIAVRRQHKVLAQGRVEVVEQRNEKVLAYIRRLGNERILVVANLSGSAQSAQFLLGLHAGTQPVEVLGGEAFPRIGAAPYSLTLAPHGFYWFTMDRVSRELRGRRDPSVPAVDRGADSGNAPGLVA
jgi:maltose alpha-D-glucosyltransferase/alpha-amylase